MESGKKSLRELMTAGVFHVPQYQRYYSWTTAECDDLWTDLYTLPDGKQHYFGTIIIQKMGETETGGSPHDYGGTAERSVNLLIDGQQRLTSLAILVRSMIECLEELAAETDHEQEIHDDIEEMRTTLLVEDNIYQVRLLDEEDQEYLERIITGHHVRDPQRPSQRKMIAAKAYFDDQLATLKSSSESSIAVASEIKQLWNSILELELMVYVVGADNPEKATLIFDSVNDRGRSLSTLDKTKSFLMRMAYLVTPDESTRSTIRRIRQAFGAMYNEHQTILESPHTDELSDGAVQRYHFITFFEWTESDQYRQPTFLDALKEHVRTLRSEDPAACLEYIERYTDSLERGFNTLAEILNQTGEDDLSDLVDRVHKLRNVPKFYPLLMEAWPDLPEDDRQTLLKAIETYIFRVYAMGNHRSYTGESSLYVRARDLDGQRPVTVWVREIAVLMNRYEDDSTFRRTLQSPDLYPRLSSKDLRYLFYFYNRHRAAEKGERGGVVTLGEAMGSGYTIEHIWPQNPDELPVDEAGDFASPVARFDAYVHRLGNLTLASKSWNAEWGARDVDEKLAEGYDESKLWVQWDIQDWYDEWSIQNIEDREATLIEQFIFQHWPTPGARDTARLTERERCVLQALHEHPDGAVRGVIHQTACSLPSCPFENPDSTGWERRMVGFILNRLEVIGLADRDKRTWFPTDRASEVEASGVES